MTVIGEDLGSVLHPRFGSTLNIILMNMCDEAVLYHPDLSILMQHTHTHIHSAFPAFLTRLCLYYPFSIAHSPHFLSLLLLFSTALKGVRERTCVCVTQVSPTLFSLSHQSPQIHLQDSTYAAYGHDVDRMDCVTSPEGLHVDSAGGKFTDFIATVRIRLIECSGARGEGGREGGRGEGAGGEGGGEGRGGGSSSGFESSQTVDITVEFERYIDFTDVLSEFNRILSTHGTNAAQSDPTSRKIVFDGVQRGNTSSLSSFVDSLCAVFPRPVSVFETLN